MACLAALVVRRFPQNPLLRPADIPPSQPGMHVECLLNPGVFRFEGKIGLLLRVAERTHQQPGKTTVPILSEGQVELLEFDHADPLLDLSDPRVVRRAGVDYLTTLSHLRVAWSEDGVHFQVSGDPLPGLGDLESYGIEDCRVSQIGPDYYLTYTAVSPHGVGVGLRTTRDWRTFQPRGMIFPPHNKDCAIFEEKIGGYYYALHRPSSPDLGGNYMWLARSPDLLHWGQHHCLIHPRSGHWDSARVGAGAAPIRTERGWLEIYHGANSSHRYCLGALLLDLDDPARVLARSLDPIMEPLADYEQNGFFGHVVFTNGHLLDGDRLTVYYGASDSVICAAQFSVQEILDSLVLRQVP